MEIEIYQQSIKVETVEMPTAEQSRADSAIGRVEAELELARRIAERDAKDQAEVSRVLQVIAERISQQAEKGNTRVCLEWEYRHNGIPYLDFDTWNRLYPKFLRPVLEGLGYKVYNHEYSDSWKRKSDKYGYCVIDW